MSCRPLYRAGPRAGTTGRCGGTGTTLLSNRARHGHDGRRAVLSCAVPGPARRARAIWPCILRRRFFHFYGAKKSSFTSNSEINYLSSLKYKKYILKG
jgi:hypothetical protein